MSLLGHFHGGAGGDLPPPIRASRDESWEKRRMFSKDLIIWIKMSGTDSEHKRYCSSVSWR
jgi:hypothetical protein